MKDLESINICNISPIRLTAGVTMNLPKYIGELERGGITINDRATKVCKAVKIDIARYEAMLLGCMRDIVQYSK